MALASALDEHGYPAFVCARDHQPLAPVEGEDGVLRCPSCGHRTDEPGEGVLADAFDVLHRQWGLRGDPHAWQAVRELVATTPTSTSDEDVRAAFVDALRQVIGVDIDQTDEPHVLVEALDHGGMSGGAVDVGWWRTKGIPLLVSRATDRRPVAAIPPRRGSPLVTLLIWAVVIAIPGAPVVGGAFLLYQNLSGTRVQATVLECEGSGGMVAGASTYRTECVAEWTIDGRVVIGGFTGGNGASDVGKTVDATVRGDTAYSRSLLLPILLLALGLPLLAGLVALGVKGRTARQRA